MRPHDFRIARWLAFVSLAMTLPIVLPREARAAEAFEGQFYRGEGNVDYLRLLDISRRLLDTDAELPNLPMLYTPVWNGFVEGPTWGAWWIQNSYGTTYCALPILQEPYLTFLQNAQDLWFDQMGDGKRAGFNNWVAPDGCLCDAASPGWIVYKQGDGRTDIHDWGMEFTAAGLVLQSELLLISRDREAIQHYLPMLERCASFIESRRDPEKNLFWAGPAGNLLAPSYAGLRKPDGTFDKAYLVGLGVTYIAALDRLIELQKMVGCPEKADLYAQQRDAAKAGLSRDTTEEGYLLKYLDPDGTKHGLFGADKHGYFEAVSNHDAICFRVTGDDQSRKIMDKLRSIPGLRPHDLIITNYPSLDDMYVAPDSWLWKFGTWVNGGHWTTCEARMIMAYYRMGHYEDAARAMQQILKFARKFRMDNPLVDFGNEVYQPNEPINLCYDTFGAPAAMVRGLFEYLYRSDRLTLIPHIPADIVRLQQNFPVRFGKKQIYLATVGAGPISAVTVNGQPWKRFDGNSIELTYEELPDRADVVIGLGGAAAQGIELKHPSPELPPASKPLERNFGERLFPVISQNGLPLRIGADSDGNNRFIGQMARARLFNRALSPAEIETLAKGEPSPLDHDAALIGDWKLGMRNGDTVPNSAGEQLAARVVGEANVVDGPQGKVLQLTGKGYLEVAADPRLECPSSVTLEAWISPDSLTQGGARILDKSRVGTSNGYLLDTHPGNSLRLIVERASLTHDAKLAAGKWTHVAATADPNGTVALYVDGKPVVRKEQGSSAELENLADRVARLRAFYERLVAEKLGDSYEAAHVLLAIRSYATSLDRFSQVADGRLARIEEASQHAADKAYLSAAGRLCEGWEKTVAAYEKSDDPRKQRIFSLWMQGQSASPPKSDPAPRN